MRKSLYFWTFLFIYYFLFNLQFHNSRAVYNKGSQEGYTNLVTNIVKLHAAQAGASEHLNTLVIKPIFKCTPQIKIIKERYVKKDYLKIIWKSFFYPIQVSTFKTCFSVSEYLWDCVILYASAGCISATSSKVEF